jgi:uncharacterized coiled-coil protein SlyX
MSVNTFLKTRIAAIQVQIAAYEDAITAISSGVQSYTLDTGQTRQVVTRFDVDKLQSALDSLYNRYSVMCTRLNGGGVTVRPSW